MRPLAVLFALALVGPAFGQTVRVYTAPVVVYPAPTAYAVPLYPAYVVPAVRVPAPTYYAPPPVVYAAREPRRAGPIRGAVRGFFGR